MDRNVLSNQLQEACDLEEKFILEFDTFFKEHVSDNYQLNESEKDFVNTKINILLVDSKRHLEAFQSLMKKMSDTNLIV